MSEWQTLEAPAKLNLALVVGPARTDGKHEVATVLERLTLADVVAVRLAPETRVTGFADDRLVRSALDAMEARSGARFEAPGTARCSRRSRSLGTMRCCSPSPRAR